MGNYADVQDVAELLGITIDGSSTPTSSVVSKYIDRVEAGVDARALATYTTLSGTKFDVQPTEAIAKETIGWFFAGLPETTVGRVVVPPYTPIITVLSGTLQRNKAALDQAEDWETLKEGPGDDTDYVVLKTVNKRTQKEVGYAIFFYNRIPTAGRQRVRATWTYGYGVDSNILNEYVTLKAAEQVLLTRVMTAQPSGVAAYTAGADLNTYVNTQYEAQLSYIRERVKEIEDKYFPRETPVGVLQGV